MSLYIRFNGFIHLFNSSSGIKYIYIHTKHEQDLGIGLGLDLGVLVNLGLDLGLVSRNPILLMLILGDMGLGLRVQ